MEHQEFFSCYTDEFKENLSSAQKNGLSQILSFLEQDRDITDKRWIAYILATAKHECANK